MSNAYAQGYGLALAMDAMEGKDYHTLQAQAATERANQWETEMQKHKTRDPSARTWDKRSFTSAIATAKSEAKYHTEHAKGNTDYTYGGR